MLHRKKLNNNLKSHLKGFLGSNGYYYGDPHFSAYTAVRSGRSVPSFRRNLLPHSSGYMISTAASIISADDLMYIEEKICTDD
jgi:hypothetical protein